MLIDDYKHTQIKTFQLCTRSGTTCYIIVQILAKIFFHLPCRGDQKWSELETLVICLINSISFLVIIHVLMLNKIVVVVFFLGHHAPKHLLRCENPNTFYVTCPETGRHSLKIPLDAPQGTLTIKCSYTA